MIVCGLYEAQDYELNEQSTGTEIWMEHQCIPITQFNLLVYETFQKMDESFNKDANLGPTIFARFVQDYALNQEELEYALEGMAIIRDMYDGERERVSKLESQKAQKEHDKRMSNIPSRSKRPRRRR